VTGQWDCGAYGPEGRAAGALCFVAGEPGTRACASPAACRQVLSAERQRMFSRISELAAQGDPDAACLAEAFPRPGMLLGGDDDGQAAAV